MPASLVLASIVLAVITTLAVVEAEVRSYLASRRTGGAGRSQAADSSTERRAA